LPALVASKGKKWQTRNPAKTWKLGRRTLTGSFWAAFKSPGHLLRRLIQSVIEAGETRVASSCPPGDLGERSQVDAVEASQAVLLGKIAGGAA
jgi:hypothetical protein